MAALDGGRFGEVASYLPGRKVTGVVVRDGRVRVQVRVPVGRPGARTGPADHRRAGAADRAPPVDVAIADIDDPPGTLEAAGPRPRRTVPGTGPPA